MNAAGVRVNLSIFWVSGVNFMDRRSIWRMRKFDTQIHHWMDRRKLKHDFDYLFTIYETLLADLAVKLNAVHGVNLSVRYWRIILGPWLLHYVPSLFDRRECLEIFTKKFGGAARTIGLTSSRQALRPGTTADFIDIMPSSDLWNHAQFLRIIEHQFADQIDIEWLTTDEPISLDAANGTASLKAAVRNLASICTHPLNRLAINRNDYIFHTSYFPIKKHIELSVALRQWPELHFGPFLGDKPNAENPSLSWIRNETLGSAALLREEFERLLYDFVLRDLPTTFLEQFADWRRLVNAASRRVPKAIFSATSIFADDGFKFWTANMVEEGAQLVVGYHGGSMPSEFDSFQHELAISDRVVTWFIPYDPKQTQLSPSKIREFTRRHATFLTVVGNEMPRYPYRATASPIAEGNLVQYEMSREFFQQLDLEPFAALRFRPYPNRGWNTRQRFSDEYGPNKLTDAQRSLLEDYAESKLIVCTYPDTTFSEAMASSVPTIIVYPEALWERDQIAQPLIRILKEANILFHSAADAALHVNNVWSSLDAWWMSPVIESAKQAFFFTACRINKKWKSEWKEFFQSI